jgi:thiopurine S-methyltransferase
MTEQHLSAVMSSEPPFTILRAGHITFYVGDFFSLQADRTGQFDLIYDRAALIALPAEMRKGYVERLRTLLNPQGRLLLVSIEYDAGAMNGPPFAVTEDEVRNLFAGFSVNKLIEYDCIESEPQFKARGLQWLKEAAYKIHST